MTIHERRKVNEEQRGTPLAARGTSSVSRSTTHDPRSTAAVIVAAGRGERMGARPSSARPASGSNEENEPAVAPKQLRLLAGKPVISWSVEFFGELEEIGCLCIVTRPELRAAMERLEAVRRLAKPLYWAEGGARRQDSSRNGVMALPRDVDVVAVHDAARPFPPREATREAIRLARKYGAAIVAMPVSETVKRADEKGVIIETVDRARLWVAQTPQVFRRDWLMDGFDAAAQRGAGITDDAAALEAIGRPVRLVAGSHSNLKITTPEDFLRAELIAMGKGRPAAPSGGFSLT